MMGQIPLQYSNMTSLQSLNIANTGLGGRIPPGFSALTDLQKL